jgi:hypothetical protein
MLSFVRRPLSWLQIVSCFAVALAATFAFADESEVSVELLRFPIEIEGAVIVPVEVFGEIHAFDLETGAPMTVFDAELRKRLGKPVRKPWYLSWALRKYEVHRSPEIKIGDDAFQSPRIVVSCDLSPLRCSSGQQITGVLGSDYLKSQVIRINFDEGFAALQSGVTSTSAHVEKMELDRNGRPSIMIQVSDSGPMKVIISTGSTKGLCLEQKQFDKLVRKKRIVLRGTIQCGAAGAEKTYRVGVVDQVQLGPHRVRNVHVQEAPLSVVGTQFLERFDTELDLPNQQAHFRPGRRLHAPDRWNIAGIGFERNEGKTLVHHVESHTVAERAGVLKGDLILEVNDEPAESITIARLHELRSMPGTELKLKMERKRKIKDVVLKLPELQDPFPTQTASAAK